MPFGMDDGKRLQRSQRNVSWYPSGLKGRGFGGNHCVRPRVERDYGKRAFSAIGVAAQDASPLKGVDGKRALSVIEVLWAQAPLERGLGKTVGAEITGFSGIFGFSFDLCSVPLGYA